MAKVIGCMGESGSGKTTAMRNLPPKETFYIDCDKKGLNWKGWKTQFINVSDGKNKPEPGRGCYFRTDSFTIVSALLRKINEQDNLKHIKYVVIDTINGVMVAEEMRRAKEAGFGKWTDLAQYVWEIFDYCLTMRDNVTVVILAHSITDTDDNGIVFTHIRTNGRKLEKLVLESKMTTVVWSVRQDGKYKFILSADGSTCKVPMGSFDTDEIENDIMVVIKALEEY